MSKHHYNNRNFSKHNDNIEDETSEEITFEKIEPEEVAEEVAEEVEAKFISEKPMGVIKLVGSSLVNFRSAPEKLRDNVLSEEKEGTQFMVLSENEDWYKVRSMQKPFVTGWIVKEFAEWIKQ